MSEEVDDWGAFEELARLLGEPSLAVDVSTTLRSPSPELGFAWLAEDSEGSGSVPVADEEKLLCTLTPSPSTDPAKEADAETAGQLPKRQAAQESNEACSKGAIEAVTKNREYQSQIREVLDVVEQELSETRKLIHSLKDLQTRNRFVDRSTYRLLSNPFDFILKAVENQQVALGASVVEQYKALQAEHQVKAKTWKWTTGQRRMLAKGVRQFNQKLLMDAVMERGSALSIIQRELDHIRNMNSRELEMNLEGLDFGLISRYFVPKKSPIDCEIQWRNVDHPAINKNETWSGEEVRLLGELGDKVMRQETKWTAVSARLGTGRSPFSCVQEYQKRFHPHGNRGRWRPEEDEALRSAVSLYGESEWPKIAALVPGRSSAQCLHRWRKALSPQIRRGRWTKEEDAALERARMENPDATWKLLSQAVPGRTDVQCRERWTNVLDPSVIKGGFTPEEDDLLREAVAKYGEGHWSAVSDCLPGRTDSHCKRRWLRLTSLDAARKIGTRGRKKKEE